MGGQLVMRMQKDGANFSHGFKAWMQLFSHRSSQQRFRLERFTFSPLPLSPSACRVDCPNVACARLNGSSTLALSGQQHRQQSTDERSERRHKKCFTVQSIELECTRVGEDDELHHQRGGSCMDAEEQFKRRQE